MPDETGLKIAADRNSAPRAVRRREGETLILEISGTWQRDGEPVTESGDSQADPVGCYNVAALGEFDTSLPAYLYGLCRPSGWTPSEDHQAPSFNGLPADLRGLLELALSVPEEVSNQGDSKPSSEIRQLGAISMAAWGHVRDLANFTGRTVISLVRLCSGRAHFRSSDFWLVLQQCGVQALPIVSLISFLIGIILAFVGNVQLSNFGANLFVADLVGIAMVREMGVVMTAIIMSGRTGAAFAAHIGSMKANEEIDALRTFGFDPFDFLVLPRILALIAMMPVLTIYANIVGILGGMLVGAFVGIPPALYWAETLTSVDLTNSFLGVLKSIVFGAAIAINGCMQGMVAENSSAAVGEATTRAVVASITAVIVLDSAFAVAFTLLDI